MDNTFTFTDQKFTDFINNLSSFVSKNKSKVNEAYEYFKSADADIKAAELLYNIKINSLALFHLQQAAEKILDGIGYMSGYISYEEIKKSNHVTPKIYYKLIYKVLSAISDIKMTEAEFSEKREDVAKLSSNEIKKIMNECDENKIEPTVKSIFWKNIDKFLKEARRHGKNKTIIYNKIGERVHGFVVMTVLSRILYPHEAYTRYPDGNIKPSDYNNLKLGIAENIEELINLAKKSNQEVSEFIKSLC